LIRIKEDSSKKEYKNKRKGMEMRKKVVLAMMVLSLGAGIGTACGALGEESDAVQMASGSGTDTSSEGDAADDQNKDTSGEGSDEAQNEDASGAGADSSQEGEDDAAQSGEASDSEPAAENANYIESAFAKYGQVVTSSVGEVGIPYFIVEFQDVKFGDELVPQEELEEWLFTGRGGVADYYDISSHGRLKIDGDVYYYTASGDMASYETSEALEQLVMEMLDHYEEEVDFSQYDKNGDQVIDALMLSVPQGGNSGFWWGATHTWYANPDYTVDGLYLVNYVVNDDQPYKMTKRDFLNTVEHEFGHCLGLPDYYKYEYSGSDYEGMHGDAGKERMDDSTGDFCQFSKILLGWLTEEQVQIMPSDVDEAEFFLPPVKEGGCLVIFPRGQEPDFQSEYFVVEYNTLESLWAGVIDSSGVRVLHAQAELLDYEDGYFEFKYGNFSPYYDTSNNGIRVLKLVRDGKGFFKPGNTITYEGTGGEKGNFGWYTEDGTITEPGFHIEIGEVQEDGCIQVKVFWD